jgi:very-short-patch-repair endonuclease
MTEIFNLSRLKKTRRALRSQPILCEKLLWWKIRNENLGYRFRRQFSIGNYIVDFYCPKLKLVIEIDGATRATDKELKHDK